MEKAESYLSNRLEKLTEEKVILISKINNMDLEMEEIEYKIKELKENLDDSFEVFSPRTKKNDFTRNEISRFEIKLNEMMELKSKYEQQVNYVTSDMEVIEDALSEMTEADRLIEAEADDEVEEENSQISDKVNSEEDDMDSHIDISGIQILKKMENDSEKLSSFIEQNVEQSLSNLIHKCSICSKLIGVDTTRAKMEMEVMESSLKETYNEILMIQKFLNPSYRDADGLEKQIDNIAKCINKEFVVKAEHIGNAKYPDSVYDYSIYNIFKNIFMISSEIYNSKNVEYSVINHEDEIDISVLIHNVSSSFIEGDSDKEKIDIASLNYFIDMKNYIAMIDGVYSVNHDVENKLIQINITINF